MQFSFLTNTLHPSQFLCYASSSHSFRMPLALTLLGLLLLSLHISASCAAMDTMTPGQALFGNNKLVSNNGKFALGFFHTGSKSSHNTLNWYLGIWYNKIPKLTPVWVENGDNPVTDNPTIQSSQSLAMEDLSS